MALSKKELEAIRNNAKSKSEKVEDEMVFKHEKESDDEVKKNVDNKSSLEAKIKKLRKEKEALKVENTKLKHDLAKDGNDESMLDKQKAIDAMVMGSDERHFVKKYDFTFNGNKHWKFTIRMHAPSVFEEGVIEDEFYSLTNGNGYHYSDEYLIAFKAIAYFRVVGDDVPEELKDPERLTRIDILIKIFTDFANYLDTFRQNQKY